MAYTHNHLHSTGHTDERRRPDWQENDRRRTKPWVVDSNDRRSGRDRRVDSLSTSTN